MEKLEINYFKAFNSRIALIPTASKKNLLIVGENGSGKSSLFEAIRMVFYHNEMLAPHISKGASLEIRRGEEESFYRDFNHKQPAGNAETPFSIKINDTDFKLFNTSNYSCYMLSNTDLQYKQHSINDGAVEKDDKINIKSLLTNASIPKKDIDFIIQQKPNDLIKNVNQILHDVFIEEFTIAIENTNLDIRIDQTNLSISKNHHLFYNEAKLNLTVILILLESIRLLQNNELAGVHKLLVIDDLITSLDAGNRLFFANYLLDNFADNQKIFFTHNIGYNNLLADRIKNKNLLDSWKLLDLYITESGPQLYSYADLKTALDIKNEFDKGLLPPANVGYELRKRFEADLNEIAKLFHLDATSMAMNIIASILAKKGFYYRVKNKKMFDANDLVYEIDKIVQGTDTDPDKVFKIKAEIAKYCSDSDVANLFQFIKEFQFYEKLFVHSLAHGTAAMPTFHAKEVDAVTRLLYKIEKLKESIKYNITTP